MTQIIYRDLFGSYDKVQRSIEFLKTFEPPEGYYLAFSGGKDSICIYHLAKMAGVKFDAHYNRTGIDPPDLVKFIKDNYPSVVFNIPEKSFFQYLLIKRWPPLRMQRWCCELLKETGGTGRRVVTGVRWEESNKRRHRKQHEVCFRDNSKHYFHPIIDWTEKDVWKFIRENNLKYPSLYDEGWKRIGCLACPMSNKQQSELIKYPKYRNAYIKAFDRLIKFRSSIGLETKIANNGKELFEWWISRKAKTKKSESQLVMFE